MAMKVARRVVRAAVPATPGRWSGGTPALPAVEEISLVTLPSVSMPRDYQLTVAKGNYTKHPGSVKVRLMKHGSESGSIHISRADALELARLISAGTL